MDTSLKIEVLLSRCPLTSMSGIETRGGAGNVYWISNSCVSKPVPILKLSGLRGEAGWKPGREIPIQEALGLDLPEVSK